MRLSRISVLLLPLLITAPASHADVAVGDTVTLKVRAIGIPAHPAPADNHVPFRFQSGSQATVTAIDAASEWIQIAGVDQAGNQATGWITPAYIAGSSGGAADVSNPSLDWCPAKGSSQPHPSGRLRLATWNLGALHAENGQSIFSGANPSPARDEIDYERMRCYVRLIDPDILAVQEVDWKQALQRVVDTDVYEIHVSSRGAGNTPGKQNTGFAYKKELSVSPQPDVTTLNTSGQLRHGTRIDVTHNAQTLKLMSVHLKSGCFSNTSAGGACTTLATQIPQLETWIDTAANDTEPLITLGDFNRRFNESGDLVWTDLDDGNPANADLTAATEEKPISCRDNEFTEFIDHIVFDKRSVAWFDHSPFRHVTFRQADRDNWNRISDHCPVVVELWIPSAP